MPVSEARISANRANSLKSCGPKTPEGKERSRRNGLKHGMTGRGIVVLAEDAAEVERRNEALLVEMAPKSEMGAMLIRQMATLSVRMERGAKQESSTIASRVRNAADDFDEGRIERAEALLATIGEDPRGNLRRLRKSPEGVDLLIQAWEDLWADLTREEKPRWTASELVKAANLVGLRDEDARGSRIGALSRGFWGDFHAMEAQEGGDLEDDDRKIWAKARLVERIEEEIAKLEAHFETLDFKTIEQDRAEAGDRALFDPSKQACLARRYESEARRGFFQSLKEFRQAESEVAEGTDRLANPTIDEPHAPLASSCGAPRSSLPTESTPRASTPPSLRPAISTIQGAAEYSDGLPLAMGRPPIEAG